MCSTALNPLGLVRRAVHVPEFTSPPTRRVRLGRRGTTLVTDLPGPAGAPTVVLLHAVGCTGQLTWFPVLAALSQRYRVVTFDQRWHGQGIQSEYFSLHDCADDVAALVGELGLENAIIGGYSMGSIVAQRVWRQHPDVVSGLVLAATTDRFRTNAGERVFHEGLELGMGALRTLARSRSVRKASMATARALQLPPSDTHTWALEQWRQTSPWAVAQAVAALGRHHSRPWLGRIDVPTAVVVTENDHVIPPERQRALAARIKGASVHPAPVGHAGCVLETKAFVPVFLEAVNATAARVRDRRVS